MEFTIEPLLFSFSLIGIMILSTMLLRKSRDNTLRRIKNREVLSTIAVFTPPYSLFISTKHTKTYKTSNAPLIEKV